MSRISCCDLGKSTLGLSGWVVCEKVPHLLEFRAYGHPKPVDLTCLFLRHLQGVEPYQYAVSMWSDNRSTLSFCQVVYSSLDDLAMNWHHQANRIWSHVDEG